MSAMNRTNHTSATVTANDSIPGELHELIAELEADPAIRLLLDEAPMPGTRVLPLDEEEGAVLKARRESLPAASAPVRPTVYRDPADVVTIHRLAWTTMFMVLAVVVSSGLVIAMYVRRPDRIVVDRTTGRTLVINDREYGETEAAQMGPDRLTNQDKQYITREFVQALYRIDPATRSRDIERALRMMVPDSALKFARYLKQDGTLDRQRSESWQAVWTPQDVAIDSHDPYTVRVIGRQDISRVSNGVAVEETRQLNLTLKLVADPQGRADRNLRSGFLIASIDYKELAGASAPPSNQTSQPAPTVQ